VRLGRAQVDAQADQAKGNREARPSQGQAEADAEREAIADAERNADPDPLRRGHARDEPRPDAGTLR
jgi:hypothetical protein